MINPLYAQDPIEIAKEIPGPTVTLFCLMAVITAFSSELGEYRLALSGIAGTVALTAIVLSRWRGGGFSPALFGVMAGLATISWQQLPVVSFPETFQKTAVFFEGVVLDRKNRQDSIQLILDRGVIIPGQNTLSEPIQIPGRIQITTRKKVVNLAVPGDKVRVYSRIKPFKSFKNPGSFDYARFQHRHGILFSGYTKNPVEIVQPAMEKSWNRYRQTISQWIIQVLPPEQQGLAEALMVGKRGMLDQALREDLLVSGTFHLVAISGLHLGMVAGWSFVILRFLMVLYLPLSQRVDLKRPAAILAVFPTISYAFLAGWSVPTQRAATMVSLLLLAIAIGRARQVWRVLNLAAIVMLLYQPWQLFSAGFQLSFLSVIGLLFFMPFVQYGQGWRKKVFGIFMVSLVALFVSFPVVAHHFHRLTPYGLVANLVSVPWVSLVSTPLGLLAMLMHEMSPTLGDFLLQRMGDSLALFRWGIGWISDWPGSWQRLPGPSLIGMTLALGFCALAGLAGMAGMSNWRNVLFAAAFPCLFWPRPVPATEQLHLAVLDVGQAQSVVLYTPNGGWSVLDAGGWLSPRFNTGEAVISTYLWHYGVTRLERVVISHPQMDHMAGAKRLLRNFEVGSLWLGMFPKEEQENATYLSLVSWAENHGVPIRRIHQKTQVREGDAIITVLPPLPETRAKTSNDRSLVVEIAFDAQRFLIPGDATARTEKWLLAQKAVQTSLMLLAPHHGSKSSSTPAFVHALQPQHVVFSVGLRNAHHHPHPDVVQRWRTAGAHLWRTDQQGAVVFQSDGKTIHITVAAQPDDPP